MIHARRLLAALVSLLFCFSLAATAAPASAAPAKPSAALPQWPNPFNFTCKLVAAPLGGAAAAAGCDVAEKAIDKAFDEAVVKPLTNSIVKPIADGMANFTADIFKTTLAWWLYMPSVQVKDTGIIERPKCDKKSAEEKKKDPRCSGKSSNGGMNSISLQALLLGIGVMIATLLTIFQGIRTVIRRKGAPLMEALQGLVMMAIVCAIGITVVDSLLLASDKLTDEILDVGFNGKGNTTAVITKVMLPANTNPVATILLALMALIVGLVQVIMLFLRQAAIPIQALLLPIAASGQAGGQTSRQWLPRIITAIMSIIVYKPMAALILAVGFTEMVKAPTMVDWTRGAVTLVLSILAMKSLLNIFAPFGAAVAGGVNGAAVIGGLIGAAGSMLGARGGGGGKGDGASGPTSPVQHAKDMEKQGPGPNNPPPSGGGGGTAVQHANSGGPGGPGSPGGAGGKGPSGGAGQPGGSGKPGSPGESPTAEGAQQVGQQAKQAVNTAAGAAGAAGGGPAAGVQIAMVAAEAVQKGIQASGDAMGGGKQ
ncbi:hypothetical protein AB0K09_02580 [Streptomyces sp. NPDC049577]|uniref:hypothetical protein n=1 Tax=Streptomyces sp. NPDC049577 TaxID=3155153 RepID=UPI0034181DDA